jgi:phosphate-selective porin OprO/OprP
MSTPHSEPSRMTSITRSETDPLVDDRMGGEVIMPGPRSGFGVPINAHHGPFRAHTARRPGEIQEPTTDPRYDRVVDLYGANERQLIQQVREVVEQTEVGVDTTDERWISIRGDDRITWGGRIETDAVNWIEDDEFRGDPTMDPFSTEPLGQENYVEFRRLRLFAAGEGYGVFDYQLEFEFAEESVQVQDAFVGMRDLPLLGYALIGHFRIPIGLENRTSTRHIPFMERSLPDALLPGREVGVAFFNQSRSQRATWSFGGFFDSIDDMRKRRVDDNQGIRALGRITWTPFYDEPSLGNCLFHLGAGYLYTRPAFENTVINEDPDNAVPPGRRVSFSSRPEINRGDRIIDTDTLFADQYHVGNVEMAYANGPLTLQSELTWASVENTGGGTSDLYGAYAHASWFLTGERRSYDRRFGTFGRVIPYENFWVVDTNEGKRAGLGAWEFAVRWSYLSFADVNDQSLHDITLGLNWYWNPHTRMMINWIHPIAQNSLYATDDLEDAHGDILALRLAIDF